MRGQTEPPSGLLSSQQHVSGADLPSVDSCLRDVDRHRPTIHFAVEFLTHRLARQQLSPVVPQAGESPLPQLGKSSFLRDSQSSVLQTGKSSVPRVGKSSILQDDKSPFLRDAQSYVLQTGISSVPQVGDYPVRFLAGSSPLRHSRW